jgi:uncharacterized protein involved in exopolysaccharide biosynthesis
VSTTGMKYQSSPAGRVSSRDEYVDLSLRDVLTPLFRRKRLIIGTFLGVFLAVLLLGLLMPRYRSQMSILVDRERVDLAITTDASPQSNTTETPLTEEEVNSEVELIKSRDVLEQVVRTNGLANSHGFSLGDLIHGKRSEPDRVAAAVESLAKKLKIEAVAKTNVIQVAYSSPDPQLSYHVLKSLGDLYMEKHVAVHRPAGSYAFFAGEANRYKKALDADEALLRNFGNEQGLAAPDLQRTNMALQVTNSVGLMHAAQQAIASDEQRMRSDRQQMGQTPQRVATLRSSAAADKLLSDLNASLLAAQTKRTQLALKYDPNFPLMKEADQEVAQAQAAIDRAEQTRYVTEATDRDPTYELLREDLARTQSDLAGQHANLAAIQKSIHSMQGRMVDLDKQSLDQGDLQREAKADEGNYLVYLAKREQARTSDALDRSRIANVSIAVPPAIPALPIAGFGIVLLTALGAATFLSLAIAYCVDYFDPSFHTPAQVVDILGVPVVVGIPRKRA